MSFSELLLFVLGFTKCTINSPFGQSVTFPHYFEKKTPDSPHVQIVMAKYLLICFITFAHKMILWDFGEKIFE